MEKIMENRTNSNSYGFILYMLKNVLHMFKLFLRYLTYLVIIGLHNFEVKKIFSFWNKFILRTFLKYIGF